MALRASRLRLAATFFAALVIAGVVFATSALATTTIYPSAGQSWSGIVGNGAEACPIDPDLPDPNTHNCELLGNLSGTINWGDGTAASSATVTRNCPSDEAKSCTIVVAGTHTYAQGGSFNGSFSWNDDYGLSGTGTFSALVAGGSRNCASSSSPAVAVTGAASSVSNTGAKLAGTVDPCGSSTTAWFDYGLTDAYGTQTAVQSLGSTSGSKSVSATLTGLTPGTTYHYRVNAANGHPTPPGLDATFTTTGVSPFTLSQAASGGTIVAGEKVSEAFARIADGGAHVSASGFSATIDWGDGSPVSNATISAADGGFDVDGEHTYPASDTDGGYNVTVTATKAGGGTKSITFGISVLGVARKGPPVASFDVEGDYYGHQAQFPVVFDGSASSLPCNAQHCADSIDFIYEYQWDIDGTKLSCDQPKMQVVFPASRIAHVTLTVVTASYPQQTSAPVEHDVNVRETEQGTAHPREQLVTLCGDAPLPIVNMHAQGLEVTQAIQPGDPGNTLPSSAPTQDPRVFTYSGVPLVAADPAADHPTLVRFFADAPGATTPVADVDAQLHAYDSAGHELPGSPLLPVDGPRTLADQHSWNVSWDERRNPTDPFNFILPPSWRAGTISLRAEILPPAGILETTCAGCQDWTELRGVRFQHTTDVTVRSVRLDYQGNGATGDPAWSAPRDPDSVYAAAKTVLPVGLITPDYQGSLDITDILRKVEVRVGVGIVTNSDKVRSIKGAATLDLLEDWADDRDVTSATPVVGVSQPYKDYTGDSDLGITRGGSLVFHDQAVSVVNQQRPLSSVAHELGHTFGRVHASSCGNGGDNGQIAEPWAPDERGALQGVGVDPRPDRPSLYDDDGSEPKDGGFRIFADPLLDGTHFTDFMSYCKDAGHWQSVRGWTDMFGYNADLADQVADHGYHGVKPSSVGSNGRPGLHVTAEIDDLGAQLLRVAPTTVQGGTQPASPVTLVAHAHDGRVLATAPMQLKPVHMDGAPPSALAEGEIATPGASSISIVQDDKELASRTRSAHAPTLHIASPRRGQTVGRGSSVTLRWRAKDADHDPLLTKVEYSGDDGRHWSTVFLGTDKGRAVVPSRELFASRNARLRITTNDGFNQTVAVSSRFRALGARPSVTITSPSAGMRAFDDASLVLTGSAFADTGKQLAGRSLSWLDGKRVIAHGGAASVSGLRPGRHALQLVARDSSGRTGSARVTVVLAAARPRFLTLSVPMSLSHRARSVKLGVAASLPGTLTIGKQRFAVARHLRTLVVKATAGRAPVTLHLTLKAYGKTLKRTLTLPRS